MSDKIQAEAYTDDDLREIRIAPCGPRDEKWLATLANRDERVRGLEAIARDIKVQSLERGALLVDAVERAEAAEAERDALRESLQAVLDDHDERKRLHYANEKQPHRVRVMENARATLARKEQA